MKCVARVLYHEEAGDQSVAHLEHQHELAPALEAAGGGEALPAHRQHLVARRQAAHPPERHDAAQRLEIVGDVPPAPCQAAELRLRADHPELGVGGDQREERGQVLCQEPVHGVLDRIEVGGRGNGHGLR
jgi:hypothetical protein